MISITSRWRKIHCLTSQHIDFCYRIGKMPYSTTLQHFQSLILTVRLQLMVQNTIKIWQYYICKQGGHFAIYGKTSYKFQNKMKIFWNVFIYFWKLSKFYFIVQSTEHLYSQLKIWKRNIWTKLLSTTKQKEL